MGAQAPMILWNQFIEQADSNCACSTVDTRPGNLHMMSSNPGNWQRSSDLYTQLLPDDHILAFNPLGVAGPIVLNGPAYAVLNSFLQPGQLENSAACQLAALELLQPHEACHSLSDNRSTTLTAWLHVTNACNLRCSYCYIDKTDEAMDEKTGRAAIDALFRSAQRQSFKTVKLKYSGGEATLNFGLVKTLHQYAQTHAKSSGVKLQGIVLSNGVALTKVMIDFIREQDLHLMISLDGSEEEHNAQRTFINGHGSYDQVTRSIDRAIQYGVRPHLSITITGHSVDGVAGAVAFALERKLLFNLNFYRDHNPIASNEALRAEDERLITAMRAAFAVIEERLPEQSLIGALVDRSSFAGPHKHSCGAGHDYLVVDHKGSVARCQMEIERPITDVFAADPLDVIQLHATGFQNISVDEKEGCRDCQWRYWCGGGCSLLTHRVTGRSDVKSPYCNVYQAIYPELLRLEGLRLLKWHN